MDFPTGRRTLLWRSTARSSVTEQWTCTSNTSAAQPRRVIKQEFLRKRGFAGVSMDRFIGMLDGYMVWYRDRRIKTEFGMSIMDRLRELGLVACLVVMESMTSPTKRHQPQSLISY